MRRAFWGMALGVTAVMLVAGGIACSDDATPPKTDGPVTKGDGPVTKGDGPVTKGDGPQVGKEGGTKDTGGPKPDIKIGDTTCSTSWGSTDACGGNLVGTWKYKAVCVVGGFFSPITALCANATLSNQAATGSGTLSFTATNFTRKVTGMATTDATIPSSCAIGGCNLLETAVKAAVPGSTATCNAGTGGACNCKLGIPISVDDTGTYTVASNVVTAIPSSGVSGQYHYCIKDNVLRYRGLASNPAGQKDIVHVLTP